MNTDEIITEWERNRNRHPLNGEKKTESFISNMWDESASNYDFHRYSTIVDDIVSMLRTKGLLFGTVLDIGCGPGTFAIPFSESAETVIALDASRPMISRLEGTCDSKNIPNIRTIVCDCNHIPDDVHCNLVFTSLCPAMNNPSSILSMERYGDVCAYVSSANTGSSIETEIWAALGEDYSYSGYYTGYPDEYLRSLGRETELFFFTQENVVDEPVEKTIERYTSLMSRYRPLTDEMMDIIKEVVSRYSDGDRVNYSNDSIMGLLIWCPPR